MPNNVVRSMVLICAMYAIGVSFLYCPIRTVPIFSYIHTSSYLYMLGTIIYIYLFIYVCIYIYIIIIYVLKNISGQYICIYYDREAAYNI